MSSAPPPRRDAPQALLRDLVLIAVVSMVVILSLATYGIFRVYGRQVIDNAEQEAISIGQAMLAMERDILLEGGTAGAPRLALSPESLPSLDRRLRLWLRPFDIVKIKIFAPDGRIAYSTDQTIIGQYDRDNPRLGHALDGFVDTSLQYKEEILDLAEERKLGLDVVETYLPIRADDGTVVGSLEVYVDVTRYRMENWNVALVSALVVGGILLVVFGFSFLMVRRATGQLRQAQADLEKLVVTDSLTGLSNRRQILAKAEVEMLRLVREREVRPEAKPVALLLLDIDRFKQCNDTWGHLAGDQVLREIAARLSGTIRRYDVAGRFGGEEFLVVLPGTEFAEARAIAERIRRAIREQPVRIDGQSVPVTASLGVACARAADSEIDAVLHRADVGLYLAKERGRDRVAWLEGEEAALAGLDELWGEGGQEEGTDRREPH